MRIRIVVALVALLIGMPARAANYTDWWWGGAAQTGQGVNVGQHGDMIFASWFTYDESGNGMWVVFSGPLDASGSVVTGTFYRTTGPPLGTSFDPAKVVATPVGTGTLNFAGMHHATFNWSVDGKSGTLALVRQGYGAATIAGRYEGTTDGEQFCSDMMEPGPMPMPMPMPMPTPMPPGDMPIHGPMTLSITVAGSDASGVVTVGGATCNWTGTATPSGQTVRILGTTTCPSSMGSAALDLTLLTLDRVLVGWQKISTGMGMGMGMGGCTRIEQFALVPAS
jgi:hypothetical protein